MDTFRDQEKLYRRVQIEQSLVSAVHLLKIFIVIFMINVYSEICPGAIKEFPIFLLRDGRFQLGMCESAFEEHKTKTIETLKEAMRWVGSLDGWHLHEDTDEDIFIQETTKKVFSELGNMKMRSEIANREAMEFLARRGTGMTTDFRWQTLSSFNQIASYKFSRPFHVFINHRGLDTKHNIAPLLHQHLALLGLNAFLDKKSMMLGEKLDTVIESAIRECKVGVAIISPNYCTSDNCLSELAMMTECEKELIPIFFDVKVSDLVVKGNGSFSAKQLHRFRWAVEFAKGRVGIVFDSSKEDWSDLINRVSETVMGMINKDREIEEIDYYSHRLLC